MSDDNLGKEVYQVLGEIKGYISSIREDNRDIWKELSTHRNEIFGTGTDGGIKGRLRSIEIKLYVIAGIAVGALAASNEPLARFLGGIL